MDDKITSLVSLPYFEGDFWPTIIEETIAEMNQEEEERKKNEAEAMQVDLQVESAKVEEIETSEEVRPDIQYIVELRILIVFLLSYNRSPLPN